MTHQAPGIEASADTGVMSHDDERPQDGRWLGPVILVSILAWIGIVAAFF